MMCLMIYLAQRGLGVLEVILHIGAHRTGTTSFQQTLRQNQHNLARNGVSFWGPRTTRGGRFSGLFAPEGPGIDAEVARRRGAISIELLRMKKAGQRALLVSEENMLGSMRTNLRLTRLYPGLSERLGRFARVFDGACNRVGLAIRPFEDYWSSSMAYAIKAGHSVLGPDDLDRLVTQPRSWRHVVNDIAAAFPGVEVCIWEFDRLIGRPQAQYGLLMGGHGRVQPMVEKMNASPGRAALREVLMLRDDQQAAQSIAPGNGRYMPFDEHHLAALQSQYAEDLAWLRSRPTTEFRFTEKAGPGLVPARKIAGAGRR